MEDLICVKNPETDRCTEGHGIPSCIALIKKKEWFKIKKTVSKFSDFDIENDYSNGGHGCIISYNIKDLVYACKIIEKLSPDVIAFVKKIQSDEFIRKIRQDIEELQ